MRYPLHLSLVCILLASACKKPSDTLFTRLSESKTGINFRNLLKEDNPEFNIIFYPYFYNGGGVAVGDINNDSLPDIFFTGNMVKNRLFINEGDMEFKDITVASHVAEKEGWCTGATMVDINADGWLDIYVSRSAFDNKDLRTNLLFINNKDLTFTEKAKEYGLNDAGYSTQASFFDYDLDNDLDMMLINQSLPKYSRGQINYVQLKDQYLDSVYRNKLFRNDKGKFTDVTATAGIKSNVLTFSLGVSTADLNQDGWPDIYIANDFKEPDHYYINNKNGTFTESLSKAIDHTSLYSMGVDVADYNNDLLPDLIVLDMLAESNEAQKMHMGGDNYTQYKYLFAQGMFPQYMKNSLQRNNGDGTFSEIGQLAGISNTDWSWSPLIADFDNDGLKDLFITNGYKRDNTDIEFVMYSMNQSLRIQKGGNAVNVAEYISHMPGIHLPNYVYKNKGNDTFQNKIKEWGFDHNTFSHGAAYADLDNDGDLDLITNNTDEYAGIYRNNCREQNGNNFIKIRLDGGHGHDFGIGCKVFLYAGNKSIYVEQLPVRGYQSSSDPVLHAGIGSSKTIDSIHVIWPDSTFNRLENIRPNRTITIEKSKGKVYNKFAVKKKSIFKELSLLTDFVHQEKDYNDFLIQPLLPYGYSHHGPVLAKGDVNGDGLEDLFVGGAKGQPCRIYFQRENHQFVKQNAPNLVADSTCESMSAAFLDADGDKDPDLYVTSGGYIPQSNDKLYADRLYINDGKGNFTKSQQTIAGNFNKHVVAPADIDGDGDIDLFIGGYVSPGRFPESTLSRILMNDGKGKFTHQPNDMWNLGIVKAAMWADVNNDKTADLIIAAEWQPIRVLLNDGGKLSGTDEKIFEGAGRGLWSSLTAFDFDYDGDMDFVAGNYGLNSQFKVDDSHPLTLYSGDFDDNGSIDPIITHFIGDQAYPLVPRDDLNGQLPNQKKRFNDYKVYSVATINEILEPAQLEQSQKLTVTNLSTIYLENTAGKFVRKPLPVEANYAPATSIVHGDFNRDGHEDLMITGNQSYNRIYLAKADANHGILLLGDGRGNFRYPSSAETGFSIRGDVKQVTVLEDKVVFGVNNDGLKIVGY